MNRNIFKIIILFFITCISISSCKEDCNECFTPPSSFYFDIKTFSGESLTATDGFQLSELEILNLTTDEFVEPKLIDQLSAYFIGGDELGWEQGLNIYQFSYQDQVLFSVEIDAEEVTEDCCSFTVYNSIDFTGAAFENLGDYRYMVQTDL